ncbi:MAG: phosphatase PAP2 family protein [Ginsengibacter sp.]
MRIVIAFLLFAPFTGFSQKDTLVKKLDSLSIKSDSLKNGAGNNINPKAYNEQTTLNFHNYFLLLGNDFKQQATLPFKVKKKDRYTIAKFAALTAAVSFIDEPVSHYAVHLKNSSDAVSSASRYITQFGGLYEIYALTGMAAYGMVFKDEKIKTTTLLATQSYLTAGAIQIVLKFVTSRQRPLYIDKRTNENEPIFHGLFFHFKSQSNSNSKSSSFPSGHTTAAFAAATVYALEYRNKPLIPILSYSAATLIGLSRITENKHWPTDVLVGAALGFLSGKQVVNNYHRFSKIKQPQQEKLKALSFNMQYFYGKLLPGVTYSL